MIQYKKNYIFLKHDFIFTIKLFQLNFKNNFWQYIMHDINFKILMVIKQSKSMISLN